MTNTITEEEYNELTDLLNRRSLLIAQHANSPLDCYSLKQKILIQRERKESVQHLTDQINKIMKAGKGA
jgi:hypothetical protein